MSIDIDRKETLIARLRAAESALDERRADVSRLTSTVSELELALAHANAAYDSVQARRAEDADAWWRALTSEQRLELVATVCRSCGDMDPRCRCGDDE